ncbi:MAG: tRNA (adenosine(37)-N6)-dimethylallyltransferase MiaA [Patescibacteria group bacterium]|jgi:tRNA dimethylallyltransferase
MEERRDNKIIVILGPTATGKTAVGVKLARKFQGEIISADSRQVYRGMDVGTGKDKDSYKVIKLKSYKVIPYHLIDVVSPKTEFNVAKYQKLAYAAIEDILGREKTPIIVGGTGLYIDAVVEGYELAQVQSSKFKTPQYSSMRGTSARGKQKIRKDLNKLSLKQLLARLKKVDLVTYKIIDRQNRRRVQRAMEIYYETGRPKSAGLKKQKPPYQFLKIGINYQREVLAGRIERRLKERLEKEGLVAEVKRLHRQGLSWRRLESFGLEYAWVSQYLQGKIDYETMFISLNKAIRDFSKRQMTWFKRDRAVVWEADYGKIEKRVGNFLKS